MEGIATDGTIPTAHVKNIIKNHIKTEQDKTWHKTAPRHSRLMIRDKHIKTLQNMNRTKTRTAIQILSGHSQLNYTLNKMTKATTSDCPSCGDREETITHLLTVCPAYARQRGEYFHDYYTSLSDIIDKFPIDHIVKYVKHTNRLVTNT